MYAVILNWVGAFSLSFFFFSSISLTHAPTQSKETVLYTLIEIEKI